MNLIKFQPRLATRPYFPANTLFPSVFDDLFGKDYLNFAGSDFASNVPSVNVIETEGGYSLEVAAPGLEKEDFRISVDKDRLTVSAEKTAKSESKDGKIVRKEFNFNAFSRSFVLPETISKDQITAQYVNGVLHLNVPKKAEIVREEKTRTIEIA